MSYNDKKVEKFPFLNEVEGRFARWTGVEESPDIKEALRDLTGDTYFEMRKLTRLWLNAIEALIRSGRYKGYEDGVELTDDQRAAIEKVDEDLKSEVLAIVETTWRSVLNKQKIGIDKLAIALKPLLQSPTYEEDQISDPPPAASELD